MHKYEVYVHSDLLENAMPKSGVQRRQILDFFWSLQNRPDQVGDFIEKDKALRERQFKIIGQFAITYWVDSPVRKVMIVDVRPAD